MKKIFCLLTILIAALNGCTIEYSTSSSNNTLIQNNDGTYTKVLSPSSCSDLEVYYLDLKNDNNETKIGDSTYIKCGNVDIVIDAGKKNPGSNTVVPFLKEKVTDKTIELLIATHTDEDHIGGFVGLSQQEGVLSMEGFDYDYILESGYETDTIVYNNFISLVNNSNAKVCNAYDSLLGNNECAKTFKIGNITLDLLDTSFYNSTTASSNDRSVVTLLTHNEITFLFPGDLESDEYLANNIHDIDIFKASHHGAKSANSQAILNSLSPDMIILSADGTSYDIPQQESLDRMYSVTNQIYATFITGTIKITSDGSTYNLECTNKQLLQDSEWFLENRILN